jgi:cytochrome c5
MAHKEYSSRSIMLITIIVSVVLIIVVWPLAQLGKGGPVAVGSGSDDDAAALRIQPIARIEMQKAAAPVADGKPRDGATVYKTVCSACHATGVAGSPKADDKAAWAPRLAQGKDALYASAMNGKNAMPKRGGAADLSDAELKAAVDYLTGLAK